MITVHEDDQAAIVIAQHYANQLNNDLAAKFFSMQIAVASKSDAEQLTRFYWEMVDQAVDDQDNEISIEDVSDLQFWMEKLMNIVMGYLKRVGMYEVWSDVSDQINGR